MTEAASVRVLRPVGLAWRHRELLREMTRREIVRRYRGSALGAIWLVLAPLLMLAVYAFVFGVVFQVRWGGVGDSKAMFAAVLFCGVSVFSLFADVLNRSPMLILENVNYVKKVVFPLEILSYVAVLAACLHFAFSLVVLLVFVGVSMGVPPLSVVALPLVLLPFLLVLVGLSWLVAALGVFLRDVAQVTGFITTAMMFLSPVFYPITAVPESYRHLLWLNPMTHVVEMFRGILIFGRWPAWQELLLWWLVAAGALLIGHAVFRRLRSGFADVL
ncbi:ABC transporter permease [Aromatoleum aromaticum]|uniref:ABC transporter permease n=1 Tax=Aromatoleum aromaticum TaxID=551760 RepID=UPI001459EFF1|nr:ABC transporter permease [Aromatoleum aromaticum]NMG56050.1 ABC transporter permease [Aromatoleum aromaticum]